MAYVATAVVMLAFDAVWLTLAADRLYRPLLGEILLEGFRLAPAVLFYLLYVSGIVVFAVRPALATGRWTTAAAQGAFLGLVAYGTYDLTNQATLRNWPVVITVIDLCWGTMLTAVSSTAGFLITHSFASSKAPR